VHERVYGQILGWFAIKLVLKDRRGGVRRHPAVLISRG
jgi:hypothetical protein